MMSGRGMTAAMLAEISKPQVKMFHLLELHFSTVLRFTDYGRDLEWNGNDYLSDGNLISISNPSDTLSLSVGTLTITLSGANLANIALPLSENFNDVVVWLYRGFIDASGEIIADPLGKKGQIDTWATEEDPRGGYSRVVWTVSNHWATWKQSGGRRTNDNDQQAAYPGDKFFEFAGLLADKEKTWGRV